MQEVSPYNQVIFSNPDDKANVDLVNSYRFRSNSPVKYRKWSPDISQEERFRKKREREDEYVRTLEPEEKPILLIKQKNLYKNCKSPHLIEDPAAHDVFYKVSKNTEIIEDIGEQININEELASKKTLVYRPKAEISEPATLKDIYKIQGIEFLPEGFLELEPLLYKDEYDFENRFHEKLFENEQRKYKSMRRKQYAQKEQKKKRHVTIFIVDQYKDHLTDYLDEWYARNHRRMTKQEIDYVAKVLNTDPNAFASLQDVYLEKKKATNARKLKEFLLADGVDRKDLINSLPSRIRKHFIDCDEYINNRADSQKPSSKSMAIKRLVENYDKGTPTEQNIVQNQKSSLYPQSQSFANNSSTGYNINFMNTSSSNPPTRQDSRPNNSSTSQRDPNVSKSKARISSAKLSDVMAPRSSQYDEFGNFISPELMDRDSERLRETANTLNSKSKNYSEIYSANVNRQSSPNKQTLNSRVSQPEKEINQIQNSQVSVNVKSKTSLPQHKQSLSQERITGGFQDLSQAAPTRRNSLVPSENGDVQNERDLRIYFDTEINTILDRIRNSSYASQNKLAYKKNSEMRHLSQKQTRSTSKYQGSLSGRHPANPDTPCIPKTAIIIDQIASDVLTRQKTKTSSRPKVETISTPNPKSDKSSLKSPRYTLGNRPSQNSRPIRMSSELRAYEADPFEYKERSGAELINNRVMRMSSQIRHYNENPYEYRNPGLTMLDKNSEELEIFAEVDTHGREKQTADSQPKEATELKTTSTEEMNYSLSNKKSVFPFAADDESLAHSRQSNFNNKLELHLSKRSSIVNRSSGVLSKIPEIKRITIVATNSRGESVVSQKLKPTLIGNHYYFQIIDDIIDSQGNRKSFVTVKNEKGEIIGQQQVDFAQLGSFHHSAVVLNEDRLTRQASVSLLARNEIGDTIAITPITMNYSRLSSGESVVGVFGPQGDRRSTLISKKNGDELTIIHNLKPIVLGNQFFRQTVTETRTPLSVKLTIATLNENGEVISKSKVSPDLAGQSYFSYVAEEQIDGDNNRKITLNTLNNKDQLILQQSFITQLEDVLQDYKAVSLLEEVEDEKGCRTLTIMERNPTNNRLTTQKQLRASVFGDEYYVEIAENEIEKSGTHSFTVSAKQSISGKLIARKTTHSKTGMILNDYLNDIRKETEEELGKDLNAKESILLRPMTEEYFIEVVHDSGNDAKGKCSVIIVAKDFRGKTLVQTTIDTSGLVKIDSPEFTEALSNIENEIDIQRTATIAKMSAFNNRISQNIRRSKLMSKAEFQEQWNTFNDEKNQPSINRGPNSSTKKSVQNTPYTHGEGVFPFKSQNVYYRRLLNNLTNNPSPKRNSTPAAKKQGSLVVETKKKANTLLLASKEQQKTADRLSSTSKSAYHDRNNSARVEQTEQSRSSQHGQPASQTSLKKNSQAQIVDLTPKTSLKSNMSNNSVVLSQFQKPNRVKQIYSERQSITSQQGESKSPFIATPKNSTTKSAHRDSLANSFHNSEANINHTERNLKFNERHSEVPNPYTRHENQQSLRVDQRIIISQNHSPSSIYGIRNSKEELVPDHQQKRGSTNTHDSFDPKNSFDGQTHELIKKSQELKGYLDDYINSLSNVRVRNQPPNKHQSELYKEPKKSNFIKERNPEIVSNTKHSASDEKIKIAESDERELRVRVEEVFEQEKGKLGSKVLQRVKEKIEEDSKNGKGLMDEFYEFCERELPLDQKYKDSIMLISLFYYFLEKKNLIK